MITLEDVIEEIFGEIEDEHDAEALLEKEIRPNEWLFFDPFGGERHQ